MSNKQEITNEQNELMFHRSNEFIMARNNLNLAENKLVDFAIAKMQQAYKDGEVIIKPNERGVLSGRVEFEISELTSFEGVSYSTMTKLLGDIKKYGKSVNQTFTTVDHDNDRFHQFPLYVDMWYDRGHVKVDFHPSAVENIYKVSKYTHYTQSHVNVNLLFRSNYTNKLYDLLLTHAYRFKKENVTTISGIYYDLYELKDKIADNTPGYKDYLDKMISFTNGKPFTVKEFYDKYPKAEKYRNRYDAFKSKCLSHAVNEINELAKTHPNMFFVEYEEHKSGNGGKVKGIYFTISKSYLVDGEDEDFYDMDGVEVSSTKLDISKIDPALISQIYMVFTKGEALTSDDIVSLIIESNGNVELIKKAYDYATSQKNVNNLIGYMRSCIRDKYWETNNIESVQGVTSEQLNEIDDLVEDLEDFSFDEEDVSNFDTPEKTGMVFYPVTENDDGTFDSEEFNKAVEELRKQFIAKSRRNK